MASGEEASEPLKYQTWALKVSIHCEGCKKKVKKVLQSIDGVYAINIDAQQRKVTVIGNVDADTLLKKLIKSGRNAELWPEKKPANPNNSNNNSGGGKSKKKSGAKPTEPSGNPDKKPASSEENAGVGSAGSPNVWNNSAATAAKPSEATKPNSEATKNSAKEDQNSEDEDTEGPTSPPAKLAVAMTAAVSEGPANTSGAATQGGNAGSSGGKKKKKKKKAKKPSNPSNSGGEVESEGEELGNNASSNEGVDPPRQPVYQVPFYHSQPVYAYSTAHPSASYSNTYYGPPMSRSYVYADQAQPEMYYGEEPVSAPQGSYDLFSEENANACSLM